MSDNQTPDNDPQIQVKPASPQQPKRSSHTGLLAGILLVIGLCFGLSVAFQGPGSGSGPARVAATPSQPNLPKAAFGGIGLALNPSPEGALVARVYPGAPGARAGLEAGDIITAVDGLNVAGMNTDAISARIRGPEGSSVAITYTRNGGAPQQATVTRELLQPGTFADKPGK